MQNIPSSCIFPLLFIFIYFFLISLIFIVDSKFVKFFDDLYRPFIYSSSFLPAGNRSGYINENQVRFKFFFKFFFLLFLYARPLFTVVIYCVKKKKSKKKTIKNILKVITLVYYFFLFLKLLKLRLKIRALVLISKHQNYIHFQWIIARSDGYITYPPKNQLIVSFLFSIFVCLLLVKLMTNTKIMELCILVTNKLIKTFLLQSPTFLYYGWLIDGFPCGLCEKLEVLKISCFLRHK